MPDIAMLGTTGYYNCVGRNNGAKHDKVMIEARPTVACFNRSEYHGDYLAS